MPSIAKYFALAAAGRDVSEAYEAEKGSPKPLFLKGRVIGAGLTLGSVAISAFLGYEIDKALLNQFIDTFNQLIGNIYQIWDLMNLKVLPAIGILAGIARYVWGEMQKNMREVQKENGNGKNNGTV